MRNIATIISCVALATFGYFASKTELHESKPANTVTAANFPKLSPIVNIVHDTLPPRVVRDTVHVISPQKRVTRRKHVVLDTVPVLYIATPVVRKEITTDSAHQYVITGPINKVENR